MNPFTSSLMRYRFPRTKLGPATRSVVLAAFPPRRLVVLAALPDPQPENVFDANFPAAPPFTIFTATVFRRLRGISTSLIKSRSFDIPHVVLVAHRYILVVFVRLAKVETERRLILKLPVAAFYQFFNQPDAVDI